MATTLLLLCVLSADPTPENPWLNAKVGDTATYKTTITHDNTQHTTSFTLKKTITAVTSDTVTVQIEGISPDGKPVKNLMKYDLKKKYDRTEIFGGPDGERIKLGEGNEKITIAGRAFDCKWISIQATNSVSGKKVITTGRLWYSTESPFEGLVKRESDLLGVKTLDELVSFGKK